MIRAILIALLLVSCSGMPKQSTESSQSTELKEVQTAVVTHRQDTTQVQDTAQGSKVEADEVKDASTKNVDGKSSEGARVTADAVRDITTKNVDGIPVWWFMIGCLVAGILIPTPRWFKWIW